MNWHEEFNRIIEQIEKKGIDYADKKATSYYMQELRTSVFSSLVKKSGERTDKAKENEARASSEYKEHLLRTKEAIKEEYIAKSQCEKVKAQFEAMRSLISLDKKVIEKFE